MGKLIFKGINENINKYDERYIDSKDIIGDEADGDTHMARTSESDISKERLGLTKLHFIELYRRGHISKDGNKWVINKKGPRVKCPPGQHAHRGREDCHPIGTKHRNMGGSTGDKKYDLSQGISPGMTNIKTPGMTDTGVRTFREVIADLKRHNRSCSEHYYEDDYSGLDYDNELLAELKTIVESAGGTFINPLKGLKLDDGVISQLEATVGSGGNESASANELANKRITSLQSRLPTLEQEITRVKRNPDTVNTRGLYDSIKQMDDQAHKYMRSLSREADRDKGVMAAFESVRDEIKGLLKQAEILVLDNPLEGGISRSQIVEFKGRGKIPVTGRPGSGFEGETKYINPDGFKDSRSINIDSKLNSTWGFYTDIDNIILLDKSQGAGGISKSEFIAEYRKGNIIKKNGKYLRKDASNQWQSITGAKPVSAGPKGPKRPGGQQKCPPGTHAHPGRTDCHPVKTRHRNMGGSTGDPRMDKKMGIEGKTQPPKKSPGGKGSQKELVGLAERFYIDVMDENPKADFNSKKVLDWLDKHPETKNQNYNVKRNLANDIMGRLDNILDVVGPIGRDAGFALVQAVQEELGAYIEDDYSLDKKYVSALLEDKNPGDLESSGTNSFAYVFRDHPELKELDSEQLIETVERYKDAWTKSKGGGSSDNERPMNTTEEGKHRLGRVHLSKLQDAAHKVSMDYPEILDYIPAPDSGDVADFNVDEIIEGVPDKFIPLLINAVDGASSGGKGSRKKTPKSEYETLQEGGFFDADYYEKQYKQMGIDPKKKSTKSETAYRDYISRIGRTDPKEYRFRLKE